MSIQVLLGCTSPETAHIIEDYPYGFRLRCKMKVWIEYNPKKGYRTASQTTDPKSKTEKWNKVKYSTYSEFAKVMYLDEEGKLQTDGLSEHSGAKQFLEFIEKFPQAVTKEAKVIVKAKLAFERQYLSGEAYMTMNGVRQPMSEDAIARTKQNIQDLERAISLIS